MKKLICFFAIAVLLISLCSCGYYYTTSPEVSTATPTTTMQSVFYSGDTAVTPSGVSIKLIDDCCAKNQVYSDDKTFVWHEEGKYYAFFPLEITNNTSNDLQIGIEDFSGYANGVMCMTLPFTQSTYTSDMGAYKGLFSEYLKPGAKVTRFVAVEFPFDKTEKVTVELEYSGTQNETISFNVVYGGS